MKRFTSLAMLPPPVLEFEEYLQELWMGVFNNAVENKLDNPDARAYRAVEWYMTHREMDDERSLMIRVITPGKIQASTGKFNWTKARQEKLLKTADTARGNGIIPAIWYGDHKNKTSIGWAVEVWEQDYEGANWIYVRPFITDDMIRAKMFDGTLKYASAEIVPEIEMHGQKFSEMLTGVVVLDPAFIPSTYPAVPDSGVLVASTEVSEHETICLLTAGVELTERSSEVDKKKDTSEMSPDDVLAAVNAVAGSIETLSSSVEGIQASITENGERLTVLDGRVAKLENGVPTVPPVQEPVEVDEEEQKEIEREVKASLDEMSGNPENFIACLGVGTRKDIETKLCGVKDKENREVFLSLFNSFPKVDMTERTNAAEHGDGAKGTGELLLTAVPKNEEERAKLRAESLKLMRAEVDTAKLSKNETIQERAIKLSMEKHPLLWDEKK